MEFFTTTILAVPIVQVMLLLTLSTAGLLFGKIKFALLVNYVFTFFWGFVFNRDLLMGSGGEISYFVYVYLAFGLAVVVIAMMGFMVHNE